MATAQQIKQLTSAKKPKLKKKYLGIEIEFLLPKKNLEMFQDLLVENDLEDIVHFGTDSSVIPTMADDWTGKGSVMEQIVGRELRVLVTEEDAAQTINLICSLIQEVDGYANETCGLHVHLDMRHRDVDRIYKNLFYMQDIMFKTQSKDRRDNDYCERVYDVDEIDDNHYAGINRYDAYRKHQTIEVRIHEGTVNAREIRMWVRFLVHLVNMEVKLTQPQKTFQYIKLPNEVRLYLNGRIKKYA